ncbi:MAG TPA: Zn-dependent hydrolase [Candidatus Sulfopaludibacter sp.]|jgi:allantoate deiminase|nr:Zn-dependent hydrolase [Candidatus Sulfopaludibacter sp.]
MATLLQQARVAVSRCRRLAECTEEPGRITRTFLSPPMHEVHSLVRGWMEEAGLRVRLDGAGNLRGVSGDGPRLMIGSHLDTVPNAGAFDGILGVMMGIALAAQRSRCAVEVVGFSEEEGVRFGVPFIGSRALVGKTVRTAEVREAIRDFGIDAAEDAAIGREVKGYLEFHIEQGPVLDGKNLPVGVVTAIAGQARYTVRFEGRANHAGTTPMKLRKDALAAAAEWIGKVQKIARAVPGLVATVGQLEVVPGAVNVIPGEVTASLDVRHADDGVREAAERRMLRGCQWEERSKQAATPMDAAMVDALGEAVKQCGYRVCRMVSGAGHDAMIVAAKAPAAMVFLRSPGGVSHHPDEAVRTEDVAAALAVGARFLENWRPA